MAKQEPRVAPATLYYNREDRPLEESVTWFAAHFGECSGLFYLPDNCFLAKVEQNGIITASSGKEDQLRTLGPVDLDAVFEARLFNERAELRWLRTSPEVGVKVVISEENVGDRIAEIYGKIEPANGYLIWGQSLGTPADKWTRFGEARVGPFFVPLADVKEKKYARFTSVEYVGEYEHGNVAIAEERLTGVEEL
jgi:CRISPR-associated protein (TIGR03984 family)